MGHIRLGILPKYPKWKTVIEYLENQDIPASAVADKVIDATIDILSKDSSRSSVSFCIWFLAQLTIVSKENNYLERLNNLGINVNDDSSAVDFLAKVSRQSTINLSKLSPYTAINPIAGLALREALTKTIGQQSNTLFGSGIRETQLAFKKYSTQKQFSNLLHIYFSSFLRRIIRYVIDKEISNHIGEGRRFENIRELDAFEEALDVFASQTTRIVDEFSGGWYSKKLWLQGEITDIDSDQFVYIALRKLRSDLEISGER